MEKYYGNYLGIVVSEDGGDPERRGRVQIWIPGITNTLYAGWNDDIKNKDIYYLGDDSQMSHEFVKKLRAVLPWAECASPLIGGGTPLYYNQTSSGSYQQTSDFYPSVEEEILDPLDAEYPPLPERKDFEQIDPAVEGVIPQ